LQIDDCRLTITAMRVPRRIVTISCTAGALAGFAANSLLARAAVGPHLIDAVTFTSVRLLAGTLALAVLVHLAARPATPDPPSSAPRWAGAAALAGYAYAFAFAYARIDAGTGALMLFGAVQLTMTGWGIARGERPRPVEWLGLSVAVAGLVVLTRPGRHAPDLAGAGLMAAAGACWGFYSLLGRQARSPLARTFTNFALASGAGMAVLLLPLQMHITTPGAMLASLSGAVASGLGYTLWYRALPALSRFRAALVQLSVPVVTAVAAWPVLGEPITTRLVWSATMILGGILLAFTARRSPV
jgi:drug/metabolite transporter (DMT)-like permease